MLEETTATNKPEVEISTETSARICKHMNEDHAVSVYGMARHCVTLPTGGWKLTGAKMKKVTPAGCHLQAIMCNGDLCEMKLVEFPFVPPLATTAEVKPRLVAIHHQALSPQWQWLYTKPLALIFLILCRLFEYGTIVLECEGMTAYLDQTNWIKQMYPQTEQIAMAIQFSFYLATVLHILEASYAAYISKICLKLNWTTTVQWNIMVFLVGFPILSEIIALQKIQQQEKQKERRDKKSK